MGSNIIELAKLGHERAAELKASCGAVDVRSLAQLISDLATQLEVQHVRSTNMAVQLANAESKCRELAAENAGLKSVIAENWNMRDVLRQLVSARPGGVYFNKWEQVILKSLNETPATDAFLAEVRAQGVEMFAAHCQKRHGEMMKSEPNEAASNQAITATRRAGEFAMYFADQLRKGAAL